MDKLAGMEVFVRVVEYGSFTAAAEIGDVSTTMVAKQIKAIEKRLNAKLLHRTTRRQQLTEIGALYYERCKRVLSEFSVAENTAIELQQTPQGTIRLVAPISFGCQFLIPKFKDYLNNYPEVNISLTLEHKLPNLEKNEIGIHIGKIDRQDIVARSLRSYSRILVASPDYIKQYGEPKHPNELVNFSCLGIAYWGHENHWELVGPNQEPYTAVVTGRFTSNQGEALRVAALNGYGIILQPTALLENDLKQGRLVRILPDWSYKPTPVYLIYNQETYPSAKLKTMINYLIECLNNP
ncbi:LysR family transcriptional regulator [Acinetobacter sp. HY1485]|uniref:LysR family transcriptional regulator n=1 Tax=Acinetobacter sp. HY1485 TaxID=2970918 RepID=UPI0022B9D0C0|nr:LysR family transcriptional regulator [Acinetobacter sp. HY1485]